MDPKALEERKALLQKELEQAVNRANMCLGAIGECDWFLQQLADGEEQSSPDAEIEGSDDDDRSEPG